MPLLVVHRAAVPWRDRLRSYTVVVDGVRVGHVRDAETRAFEVAEGRHTVEFRIDWARSKPVFVDVGHGGARIECRPTYSSFEVWAALPPWSRDYVRAQVASDWEPVPG